MSGIKVSEPGSPTVSGTVQAEKEPGECDREQRRLPSRDLQIQDRPPILVTPQQPDPPTDLVESWGIVDAYFRNAADAICDALNVTVEPRWQDPTGKEPTTPAGVAFTTLAPYITAQSSIRLREAGRCVADHLIALRPLNVTQVEILRDLASGASMDDVAERHGFARRSLFREIKEVRRILKVKTKQEAITHAAHRGWI